MARREDESLDHHFAQMVTSWKSDDFFAGSVQPAPSLAHAHGRGEASPYTISSDCDGQTKRGLLFDDKVTRGQLCVFHLRSKELSQIARHLSLGENVLPEGPSYR